MEGGGGMVEWYRSGLDDLCGVNGNDDDDDDDDDDNGVSRRD